MNKKKLTSTGLMLIVICAIMFCRVNNGVILAETNMKLEYEEKSCCTATIDDDFD